MADSATIPRGIPPSHDHDLHPRCAGRGQLKMKDEEKGFDGVVCRPCMDPYKAFEPR